MARALELTGVGTNEPLKVRLGGQADRVIAIAGNPNVGKSTVFNALTGLSQHTGNWPGKTVESAQGRYTYEGKECILVDLPGTYSLMAHSTEEEIARDYILFGGADAVVVVCDATCLERNLNLALQTLEITPNVVLCVNLMDEAKKKGIEIDLVKLSRLLGVPVVGTSARSKAGLDELLAAVDSVAQGKSGEAAARINYPQSVERAIDVLEPVLRGQLGGALGTRFIALRLNEGEPSLCGRLKQYYSFDTVNNPALEAALADAQAALKQDGVSAQALEDVIVSCIVKAAEQICAQTVHCKRRDYDARDRKLDRILTSRRSGIPIMLLLLCLVFWITLAGANYPSRLLSHGLFYIEGKLGELMLLLGAPTWLSGALVQGVYRVLAWVVSVMLPPMAIFFPLFTLLEDFGYLPRVAFNLDHQFKKACACGKQALTMCMGFGCNAAGVVGCRIIDSPRERLVAIITNSFVPCNGRFPTLIAIISMFFVSTAIAPLGSLLKALMLTGVIVLGVLLTFAVSRLLSVTVLKGEPSAFTLELPPYRAPQIGKVIVRSLLDRTVFVLGRALVVAAPAGLLIFILANVSVDGASLLAHCARFLDPFARLLGLDGVILIAFILGSPANEIVVPIMIMSYMCAGSIMDLGSLGELRTLLIQNGWTQVTAISTMLFCLVHWPCSTTCMTIKRETGSFKWTLLSVALPTALGMAMCFVFTTIMRVLGVA